MTDITEPEVIRYCNAYLRPLMERMRDFKAALADATAEYAANVGGSLNTYVAQDPVIDGRAGEGIGVITKIDINRARNMLEAITAVLEDTSVFDPDDLIATYTVRPLNIRG